MKHIALFALCAVAVLLQAQGTRDTSVFGDYQNEYWEKIVRDIEKFDSSQKPEQPKKLTFKMDMSQSKFPTDPEKYTRFWHAPHVSQGNSGTCWAFSTTSFLESEIHRITGKEVDLSEMHTVYWETVEKTIRFVRERGDSAFAEGSEGNAVTRMWRKYGAVPAAAYPAMKPGQPFHNHEAMFGEMKNFLDALKKNHVWNERFAVETVRAIMDRHIGAPPESVVVDGRTMTPIEYLASLKIDLDEYMDLISLLQSPYYEMVEYDVPDNWWHSDEYLNVPLDDFMAALRYATRHGYSVALGGDVSEPGYHMWKEVAVVPTFDIPSDYIDEHARQFRFTNGTTTDDHGVHCVGWLEQDGQSWYLIKDSGSGARTGEHKGYFFYHEDYIKLKMMNIMVHRDGAPMLWDRYLEAQRRQDERARRN